MFRKIVALTTMVIFIIFTYACVSYKRERVTTVTEIKGEEVKVIEVVKTSGEIIEFSEEQPGNIYEDSIKGTGSILNKKIEIDQSEIKKTRKDSKGNILFLTTKDGKIYKVISAIQEGNKFVFTAYEPVLIPLSEVEEMLIVIKTGV